MIELSDLNSVASGINDAGDVVGDILNQAVEWSGGSVIDLPGLPGSTQSDAFAINNLGQVAGYSDVGGIRYAVEWSGGSVIDLGNLPGGLSGGGMPTTSAISGRWWGLLPMAL